jgi:glycosyltransferase involved in cell wall biosynthesis
MRICFVYDCLFPYTVGGAERWYRNLVERLAGAGHEVTYLTLRQWPEAAPATIPGVNVVAVGPPLELYTSSGRRKIGPPLRFGRGVLGHLQRHGGDYDAVHTASFPYFSVLAAQRARRRHRYRLFIDWHEVWSSEYWHEYLGTAGRIGWEVQRRCARVPHAAFCFSQLHANRLREIGFHGDLHVLQGEYAGALEPTEPQPAEPFVVFAGRHIPEKQVPSLVRALPLVRERIEGFGARIYGDGPQRPEVLRLIAELGLNGNVEAPGFVAEDVVDEGLRHGLCLVLPSRREGYGLVVVEAAARGTPSVVVRAPDNAATELIEEGRNGFIAASAEPTELAEAIIRVYEAGPELRSSTAEWFGQNTRRLSLDSSLKAVLAVYSETG